MVHVGLGHTVGPAPDVEVERVTPSDGAGASDKGGAVITRSSKACWKEQHNSAAGQ